ncbi:MAG: DUF3455 domain-containing protein [Bryobacteraceae bacterium]
MPPGLQVPAGNVAFMKAQASGTQNYICRPSASGHSWTFLGPQATLFLTFKWMNNDIRQQIATHFLSPNPAENGLPRATWQSSLDTSAVWGKGVASSIDPNFVASGAIPWLLVQTVGAQPGPAGGAFLTRTTFIHRLNTSGGVAPTTGCGASNVGEAVLAPYSTDYYFYQANHPM